MNASNQLTSRKGRTPNLGGVDSFPSERLGGEGSPETTEARAALRAVEEASRMGLSKVHLEGDALSIIKAINNPKRDMSFIGGLIEAIKTLVKIFQEFRCSHVKREGNSVAHSLAQKALLLEGNHSSRPGLSLDDGRLRATTDAGLELLVACFGVLPLRLAFNPGVCVGDDEQLWRFVCSSLKNDNCCWTGSSRLKLWDGWKSEFSPLTSREAAKGLENSHGLKALDWACVYR
ncbi:hypothetical protein U1Q18_010238 [Sarracenia purpurea var. burkii]